MTTLPTTLAMIAASLTVTSLLADHNADFNNDGFVNANDLMILTSNLNIACQGECPTDLNHDEITDQSDLMLLLGQWGEVEGYVAEETEEEENPLPTRDPNRDMSWQGQGPVLLDSIYNDHLSRSESRRNQAADLDQAAGARAWVADNGVTTQPMVYGSVDWDHDHELTEEDKAGFENWLNENVPVDYDGPICLDLEGQWWSMLNSSNQVVMDHALEFYIEGLEYAKSLRPNAKIGYWGIPKKSQTTPDSDTASIERLLIASTAIFPDVYEYNPNGNDATRLQAHIEKCIEMVNGEVPVYAQAFPRFKLDSNSPHLFHTEEEFIRDQVNASLNAVWTDANGIEHRVNGVALWDAYIYVANQEENWSSMTPQERQTAWDVLDAKHVEILSSMKVAVDIAFEEANQRRELAQQQQEEAEAAAQAAAEREEQRAQLVEQLSSANALLLSRTSSYTSKARSYRKSRKSYSKAKRALAKAKRSGKSSKRYKRALAKMKKARKKAKRAARTYRAKRSQYLAARAQVNTAQADWDQAETEWAQQG